MEIKNKLTVTRGERGDDNRGKKGNMFKGLMDKDNREGIFFESRCWMEQGRAMVGKMGKTVMNNNKK